MSFEHTLVLLNNADYAFKDKELDGTEWMELQEDHWVVCNISTPDVSMLVSHTGTYCFVYWDEADQCSQPYPTVEAAKNARIAYMQNLIGDALSQADEMNENMRMYGTIDKPANSLPETGTKAWSDLVQSELEDGVYDLSKCGEACNCMQCKKPK